MHRVLPALPPCVLVVDSFEALVTTPLAHGVNAICWARSLPGDFSAVVAALDVAAGITSVSEERLTTLPLRGAARRAVDTMREDLQLLRDAGHEPSLDVVHGHVGEPHADLPTDVHSFHVDSATAPTDTFLCTYAGAPSEGLAPGDARRRIDVPELRARLLARFGGADDATFHAWLVAHFHDLHYVPVANAQPFSFVTGNLWRIAVAHPEAAVPACIHRAPRWAADSATRLLLIS